MSGEGQEGEQGQGKTFLIFSPLLGLGGLCFTGSQTSVLALGVCGFLMLGGRALLHKWEVFFAQWPRQVSLQTSYAKLGPLATTTNLVPVTNFYFSWINAGGEPPGHKPQHLSGETNKKQRKTKKGKKWAKHPLLLLILTFYFGLGNGKTMTHSPSTTVLYVSVVYCVCTLLFNVCKLLFMHCSFDLKKKWLDGG